MRAALRIVAVYLLIVLLGCTIWLRSELNVAQQRVPYAFPRSDKTHPINPGRPQSVAAAVSASSSIAPIKMSRNDFIPAEASSRPLADGPPFSLGQLFFKYPQLRERHQSAALADLRSRVEPLLDRLKLTADEKAEFMRDSEQFLKSSIDAAVARAASGDTISSEEYSAQKTLLSEQRFDQVKNLLGDQGATLYYDYLKTLRLTEGLYDLLYATDEPLNFDQAMAVGRVLDGLTPTSVSGALTVPNADDYLSASDQARNVLLPKQMDAFELLLGKRVSQHEEILERRQKKRR